MSKALECKKQSDPGNLKKSRTKRKFQRKVTQNKKKNTQSPRHSE